MAQLSTGLVIAGAYADKVRRVLFAQLKDEMKQGRITAQEIAYKAGLLNRLLYEILVNSLGIDKGDVVRIRVEYELSNGTIEWKLDTLQVEAWKRIPQENVDKAVKEAVERAGEVLATPPTAEEREWTGGLRVQVASVVELGETKRGEALYLLKDERGDKIGIAIYDPEAGLLEALVVKGREAYKATVRVEEKPSQDDVRELLSKSIFEKTSKEEAEKTIKSKMIELL